MLMLAHFFHFACKVYPANTGTKPSRFGHLADTTLRIALRVNEMTIWFKSLSFVAIILLVATQDIYAAPVYWNVFNIEEETAQGARIVTYASLNDMLNDENRTSVIAPDGGFVPQNVVGSGASVDLQDPGVVPTPSPLALLIAGAFMLPGFSSISMGRSSKKN